MTTISTKNYDKPAPSWYRKARIVVYGIFATTLFTDTLQRFGISNEDVISISAWIISITETLGTVLANGETYTKKD